jgi:hypothetical protein
MLRNTIIFFCIIIAAGVSLSGADYPADKGALTAGGRMNLIYAGGDLYNYTPQESNHAFLIDVNAEFLQFSWPHLAWGMSLGVTHVSHGDNSASLMAIGPLLAYYFGGKDSKYYPYVMASFRVGRISLNGIFDDDDAVTYEYGGSIGLARFITRGMAITGSLDYVHESYEYDSDDEPFGEDRIGFSLGLRLFIY